MRFAECFTMLFFARVGVPELEFQLSSHMKTRNNITRRLIEEPHAEPKAEQFDQYVPFNSRRVSF